MGSKIAPIEILPPFPCSTSIHTICIFAPFRQSLVLCQTDDSRGNGRNTMAFRLKSCVQMIGDEVDGHSVALNSPLRSIALIIILIDQFCWTAHGSQSRDTLSNQRSSPQSLVKCFSPYLALGHRTKGVSCSVLTLKLQRGWLPLGFSSEFFSVADAAANRSCVAVLF